MLTALHIFARMLVWGLIGLGMALVLILVRLDQGPLALDWLKPRIERALTPDSGAAAVTADGIELRLNKDERTFDLVGIDVRYRTAGDTGVSPQPFLVFPEVELVLSVEALLKRAMIAASEVKATAPSLILTRSEDGVIGLQSEAGFDDQSDDADFGRFLWQFAEASETDERLAFLETLEIGGGRVTFYDRARGSALTAENADLMLTRQDGGIDGWLRADILQKSADPASVQLTGQLEKGAGDIAFEIDVTNLMPADLPDLWPLEEPAIPDAVRGIRLPVRASVAGKVGEDGSVSPLTVGVHTGEGVVDLPLFLSEPLDIESVGFEGVVSGDLRSVDIDQARMASRGAVLEGKGAVTWALKRRAVAVDLTARDVRAEDLKAFWPENLGGGARAWVVKNIKTGRVADAEVTFDLKEDDFGPAPLRAEAIDGSFAFEGVSVRYVEEMPELENGAGKATFDAESMTFAVESAGETGLKVTGGTVTITGIGKPGKPPPRLQVLADVEGSVAKALALLDHPPLEIAEKLSFAPSDTAGKVKANIDVRMPLHGDVTREEAVIGADAELTGLAIAKLPKIGDDIRLDQGAFRLTLDENAARFQGTAEINAVPLKISIFEPLENETSKRRIEMQGKVSLEQLEGQGVSLDGLEGAVGLKATITETDRHFWIDLEADLEPLAITPPGLVWRKPVGQAGLLHASIVKPIDGVIDVKQFNLQAGGLETSGSLSLAAADQGLETLVLDKFVLDDTDAAIRLSPDGKGGLEIVVEAERLDLDALFGADQDVGDAFKGFHVVLRASQLKARDIELIDVEADVTHRAEGWRSASVFAGLSSGGKIALEVTPDGNDRRLQLHSEDAGALIEALDLGQRVDGGSMLLSARLSGQDPVVAKGRLEISSFVLEDAPLLARMLTLASLTGIGNLLGGDGIHMDHLILPFTLDNRQLTFTDGLLRGSQLGLTVKGGVDLETETLDLAGTIIPVYTLNRLIGQVPIIGHILTGVDGRGAFAATFSIEGPNDDPKVYVNPLAILTPGLIRDLFSGLISGTLDPPDIRETDD